MKSSSFAVGRVLLSVLVIFLFANPERKEREADFEERPVMPGRRRGRFMVRGPCHRTGRRGRSVARRLFAPDIAAGMNARRLMMGRFGLAPYDRRTGMMTAAGRLGVGPLREAKRGESQNRKNEFLHCFTPSFLFPSCRPMAALFFVCDPAGGLRPADKRNTKRKGGFPERISKKREKFFGV